MHKKRKPQTQRKTNSKEKRRRNDSTQYFAVRIILAHDLHTMYFVQVACECSKAPWIHFEYLLTLMARALHHFICCCLGHCFFDVVNTHTHTHAASAYCCDELSVRLRWTRMRSHQIDSNQFMGTSLSQLNKPNRNPFANGIWSVSITLMKCYRRGCTANESVYPWQRFRRRYRAHKLRDQREFRSH